MKLGFCSISALDRPLAEVAVVAASLGLDGLEVTARPPHLPPEASVADARVAGARVREAGLDVLAFGSYLGREGSRAEDRVEREVALAEALGAPLLRVWAEPVPERPEEGFEETVAFLRTVCDAARARDVTVVVERHVGSLADTPERVERLLTAVARPNFALNYQVLDFLRESEAGAQPDDARRLVRHARYVHLKNYRPPQAGSDRLLPGGSLAAGALDQRALLTAIVESGYEGPLTIEFLSFEPKPLEEKLAAEVAFVRGVLRELGRA